ncbi:LysR family transcriptional regulator [Bacillus paralicheniformis]|uniref:LysR family transcriptional regulator n=1 Tax=Bacillus paralicheniformis TaxID=1648923 RepID=UPI0011A745ED|nr:LysR family transcriptional regulator [Bacillus paralicheniformis]MBG9884630.1 LysR family transcriptional regulator [Bacillus paralicheniformis]MBR8663475.1 LysR family transcriptional regulator [Bacillus paralicheniformis]MCY1630643.1 LysR family transcriptional regulator [Bacillus paralicheniformis]MDE1390700.1 LysR family transcriptional regulator [Bacillus paralicheniformis]MED0804435.1 LysR family transcriptional regulator [Bacillus paralicheniformis]
MHYDALKTFVTLAEVKNFTKTAELLLMSQPSVSMHIKNLEKEFQTKLFERSPKYLKITPTGETLYDRAKQMITIYEQTRQDILDHHNSIKGELKIGASFTIGEYILPSLLFDLQKEYPELELKAVIGNTEEIVQSVRLYKVDIGLIEGQTNEKELSVHAFMQDELFITASSNHPLAAKQDVTMADLQNQTWVTREVGSGTREYLNHVIRSNGLKVKSFLTISSNQGIKETLMTGIGLSLLSESVIERDVQHGNLSVIRLKNQTFTRTLSYIYSPVMQDKKNVKTFINALNQRTASE